MERPESLRGERKLLTALFIDVEGSMELAETLAAEGWAELVNEFVAAVDETVGRFGGAVDKFTGDGALVLFGAPRATEDHARRACLAALELRGALERLGDQVRQSHGRTFRARMGLNSGEVVLGHVHGRGTPEVVGHTVGLAQRMESLAPVGSVCLTERTAELLGDQFDLRDLGLASVKGSQRPVRVFELQGLSRARPELDPARRRGLSTFVGRDQELAQLHDALGSAEGSDGRVLGIVGDPGVGKSRLCHEFLDLCRARGLTVRRANVTALGRMRPLGPVLEMLRARFQIDPDQPSEQARDQVRHTLLALDERLAEEAALMCEFLGLSPEGEAAAIDPDARRRRLIALIQSMVRARGARETVVELIEDAHWIDDASEPFLAGLVEAVAGTRTLLLINYRTGLPAPWLAGEHCRTLHLASLDHVASDHLSRELLGDDPSVSQLSAQVQERSEGNPFFIEELVRNLAEVGTLSGRSGDYRQVAPAQGALPPSVESVLAARVDHLREDHKRVLQTASVLGREFDPKVLAGVASLGQDELVGSLDALTAAALVDRLSQRRFAFRHALTREVAYSSLLTADRARLHSRAAAALIQRHPRTLDERAALVAHHLEAAGERAEAARWSARAAAWVGASNPATALAHWQAVRRLTEGLEPEEDIVRLALAARMRGLTLSWRLGAGEDEVAALYQEGRELARRGGSLSAEALMVANHATVRGFCGHGREFLALSEEAVALAARADELGVLQTARAALVLALTYNGRLHDALDQAEAMYADAKVHPEAGAGLALESPLAWSQYSQGTTLMHLGDNARAGRVIREALAQAEADSDQPVSCWCCAYLARVVLTEGDLEAARELAQRALSMAQRAGDGLSLGVAHLSLAYVEHGEENMLAAASAARQTLAIAEEHQAGLMYAPLALTLLSDVALRAGDLDQAHIKAQRGLNLARAYEHAVYEIPAGIALARALRAEGDHEAALALLERAQAQIERTGARSFAAELGLARV